jgi:quercetin dioxygenase-like cupin family protein
MGVHHVGRIDWSFGDAPGPGTGTVSGLARQVVVGPAQGAVHTELAVGVLHPGGFIARHVHAFEEALYVLEGELLVELDGHVHDLRPGDFTAMPLGLRHALANRSAGPTRFLSVSTPQRLPPGAGRRDTFFQTEPFDLDAFASRAARPPFGDPSLRYVGHYDGTPPQAEALRLDDPARGRKAAGMDTALVVYSGISVKMLVDKVLGMDLLTLFTVDYEAGGSAQQHDHPFEECYVFLAGEVEAELDGEHHVLRPGDVVFAGVGSVHGFYNTGTERVRWLETQAPQPPTRHAYRWLQHWERFEHEGRV